MRVGAAILLPLLALFGFGFSLAYSFNLSRELTESRTQFAQLQAERQSLEAQYQALLQENNRLTGQVSSLSGENQSLRRQVNTLATQRLLLANQVEVLQGKLDLAKKANQLLTWLGPAPNQPGSMALLVVPMLPLSLGVAYLLSHRKATHSVARSLVAQGQVPAAFPALLTREEFHLVTRYRKLQLKRGGIRDMEAV